MPYKSVVLIKQVPDTKNISGNAMTPEGTDQPGGPARHLQSRGPERPRDGPPACGSARRRGNRHHDGPASRRRYPARLAVPGRRPRHPLSDRRFAGADTLATSYALACAIRKLGDFDLVFAGRQAIDGDTAQVGPQTAEKLGIPQITYAESIVELEGRSHRALRALDHGTEMVKCSLPCLLTVVASANEPRPASVRRGSSTRSRRRSSSTSPSWPNGLPSAPRRRSTPTLPARALDSRLVSDGHRGRGSQAGLGRLPDAGTIRSTSSCWRGPRVRISSRRPRASRPWSRNSSRNTS